MNTIFPTQNNRFYQYCSYTEPVVKQQNEPKPLTIKQKSAILGSAVLGVTPVMAVLASKKGFSLNPMKILKTPVKDWAIFKFEPKEKAIDFGPWEIISVAAGSVAGGFVGGCVVDDKSNMRAKKREVLSQLLGNVLVPVGCVWAGSSLYTKYEDKIENAMPQFKNPTGKVKPFLNQVSKKLPNALGVLTFLSIGIYCGNKVSNFINDRLYHKKVERNIKATDFAPHVDDVCMATTMMNQNSSFGAKIGRVIPFALLVPGYETGTARD